MLMLPNVFADSGNLFNFEGPKRKASFDQQLYLGLSVFNLKKEELQK